MSKVLGSGCLQGHEAGYVGLTVVELSQPKSHLRTQPVRGTEIRPGIDDHRSVSERVLDTTLFHQDLPAVKAGLG